ncbi:DUF2513 domain-containing protein [Paenibacillus sp. Lou8.1]|uniref:DUF2513 domain-containing protein n=1 Tax=Paenibacillus TaxID=44249 RepID=UPI002024095C|nr:MULTISPECIES: DUF2513 domain-containing protein [Paenibacillus]MCP3806453.1 DUF2513 domain-containing protein [Paenibacillus sp. Lou8.1]URJ42274.1 DUF2513 domain-containing protein [Paenibacillus polymyxa]
MKLNKDCIRDLLLAVESEPFGNEVTKHTFNSNPFTEPYSFEEIIYTTQRLIEANYINAQVQYAGDEVHNFYISSLTWEGHQFLDNIRDNGVWKKSKDIASRFSSVSISMLSSIASNVIAQIIKKQIGY